jgi:thioredoxin-dependent peroxiredoxin
VVILGASFDSVEANRKFAEKFEFPFDLLSDSDKSLAKAYGAFNPESPGSAQRAAFVIGKDGKVTHAWAKVEAAAFPEQVLELLKPATSGGGAKKPAGA